MTYLAQARRFTPAEFVADFNSLDFSKAAWSPKMFVLHNTDLPNLRQWLDGGATPQQRLANLERYYQGMHWHSGPHWFVAPDAIWEFCNPLQDGVHCSCANHVAFGCEMVGDYATEDFNSGPGAQVRDNAVVVVATVFKKFGWAPDPLVLWKSGLAFHKNCGADKHDCPGRNVDRADFVARVLAAMGKPSASPLPPSPDPTQSANRGPAYYQAALIVLGGSSDLRVDGFWGPDSRAAMAKWQIANGYYSLDGDLTSEAKAQIDKAMAAHRGES